MQKYDALDLTKYVYGKDRADFWSLYEQGSGKAIEITLGSEKCMSIPGVKA